MKKLFLLAGIFALMSALTINAQVTIGAKESPDPSAVLDLRSNGNHGLLLPRVELTDTLVAAPVTSPKQGLFVYNTKTSVDGKVVEGVYYYDGRRWWPAKGGDSAEPWLVSGQAIPTKATLNTQNIYQMGQVSVGTDTLLLLTQLNVIAQDKGIMIPRLTQDQRDEITKKIDNDSIYNSLMIYNTSEDCYNYYSKTAGEWQSLCGGYGNAKFITDCANVLVRGTYVKSTPVTGANYLIVPIIVSKPGNVSIVGTTTAGISFSYSGTITSAGSFTINVPAIGTPTTDGTVSVTIETNGGETESCSVNIDVRSDYAIYSISCGSAGVYGTYIKGRALNASNYIEVPVFVTQAGYWEMSTPRVSGISFEGSGVLTVGSQTVRLNPVTGSAPTSGGQFTVTVEGNLATGTIACDLTIPMTLPPMTYAVILNGPLMIN